MQTKGISSEAFRVSVSSAPSSSSQGSGQDDCDALGDVYVWGEGTWDGVLGGGIEKDTNSLVANTDALLPKPLDSALVLDVQHIACGVRHAALVTRQGEIFTWGEECGGRLGHGICLDAWQPQLIETLANSGVDLVACGEFHTCAVTMTGELYTWGDGSRHIGLLGHGNDVSHWIPKKISGPLDGIQVSSIACGPWHTALVTSTGQLFTFGDGTFGVLGHGDCKSVACPKEVESLKGLRAVGVACGVWHTAAVVEVMVGHSSAGCCSGKLFTWGDGDKGRLGHGDRETKLVPTCVPTLIDYNFWQIACGHSLTVGLTTLGQVFTMGSIVYGQLGNPNSDGKLPCLVEGKLANETVEEIACGAYHVAALTARNEVYTWGKGANGRLGHGDVEDRKLPTLVEALKDKHVKDIACGSSFTTAICLHKWVSGADQSICSGCRQSFGFTRKRHNCYNCGLVHCHSCSSKKAVRAALAPNPNKPYRVCDSCYIKLKKALELAMVSNNKSRNLIPRRPNDSMDRSDKPETKNSKTQGLPPEAKSQTKRNKKSDSSASSRAPQGPPFLQLKDIKFNPLDPQLSKTLLSLPQSRNNSRAVSPFSRRPSPPRSATPTPTMAGLACSKGLVNDLRRTNEFMGQEILNLRDQVDNLTQRCRQQETELQQTAKQAQEAISLAAIESRKCKAAKEAIKSLSAQLNYMAERLPAGVYSRGPVNGIQYPNVSNTDQTVGKGSELPNTAEHLPVISAPDPTDGSDTGSDNGPHPLQDSKFTTSEGRMEMRGLRPSEESVPVTDRDVENLNPMSTAVRNGHEAETEWVEQDEPGVYITLVSLSDGTKELKRVRFSRRRFSEEQAEYWWSDNRARVFEQYNVRGNDKPMNEGTVQSMPVNEARVASSDQL